MGAELYSVLGAELYRVLRAELQDHERCRGRVTSGSGAEVFETNVNIT